MTEPRYERIKGEEMNSERPVRGPALYRLIERAKKKHHQKAYDEHKYDGSDPDYLEAEPA